MLVTLEVSKLSGWLNADALCRESKGGHTMRGERRAGRRETAGDCTHATCRGGTVCRFGVHTVGELAGQGRERTQNMPSMVVTLEVSKLSGWLNADALCRGIKGGHPCGITADSGQGIGRSAP